MLWVGKTEIPKGGVAAATGGCDSSNWGVWQQQLGGVTAVKRGVSLVRPYLIVLLPSGRSVRAAISFPPNLYWGGKGGKKKKEKKWSLELCCYVLKSGIFCEKNPHIIVRDYSIYLNEVLSKIMHFEKSCVQRW